VYVLHITKLNFAFPVMESCMLALEWKIRKAQMQPSLLPVTCFETICYFLQKDVLHIPRLDWKQKAQFLLLSLCRNFAIQI
jgi:hypothetical protein